MDEKIIAVMGATGAGKSSMIRLITGKEDIAIGHGLTSETESIASHSFSFMAYKITLVDTPGFDDTYRSDTEILQSIVEWLKTTYEKGTKLSGILYLHRIADVRMQGSALRNLRVFQELCGKDCFKNVALCPTFWDVAEEEDSILEKRLLELTQNEEFWGRMIAKGSKVFREPLTRNQAINMIYQVVTNDPVTLQVQKEVVDDQKPFSETSAVATLMSVKLEQQKQEHDAMMAEEKRRFQEELERRERTLSEDLEGLRRVFEEKLASVEEVNEKLKAEIQAQCKPPASKSIRRKPLAPPIHRASTIPGDEKSINYERQNRRYLRYISFLQDGRGTIKFLQSEKFHGRVKCNLSREKSRYLMVCTNCLRNIGGGDCYKCVSCSVEQLEDFILCTQCFKDSTVRCNDQSHNKSDMILGRPNDVGTRCPRVISPPQNAALLCRICGVNVGRCYLHCCRCSEKFDMCINCAVLGKRCPGQRIGIPSSRHKLEICARYIET